MSEYAHPNWRGTADSYSEIDPKIYTTFFGKGLGEKPERHAGLGLRCLLGSLTLFELSYNRISALMPEFMAACEDALSREASESATRD